MSNWQIEHKVKSQKSKIKGEEIINILLENRGIKGKKEIEDFLNPDLSKITPTGVGIDPKNLQKAVARIKKAIKEKQKIIVYGDYDVDGITASAILWETLNNLGADVMPYIPSRFEEGYGLSIQGIENLKLKTENASLIITVDNGIVACDAVDYANKQGIDVIITDHHTPSGILPKALAIVHTTKLCGAGVAALLAQEISNFQFPISKQIQNTKYKIPDTVLELVALATVADLVPLTKENRSFVYFGIKALQKSKRIGLLALFQKAGIKSEEIGVYEIGHIIAPRLNAMGRLESAMESLRLICTTNKERAEKLAALLSDTNWQRQQVTLEALEHAKTKVNKKALGKLIFIASDTFGQGIVGLVAGRLVEEYYLPSIVISKGEKFSKASARSVKGFNITEFLRTASDLMVDIGGHPMAAGFTVETSKLEVLEKKLFEAAEKLVSKQHLEKSLRIDLELPEDLISLETYQNLQKLVPFGMGNPEPTFLTRDLLVQNLKLVGNDGKHLKINFQLSIFNSQLQGIYFRGGENNKIKVGDKVDVVYTLDENEWNGSKKLQLKIKDVKIS
jgi:single-stranded-DNA-specific exonuclease